MARIPSEPRRPAAADKAPCCDRLPPNRVWKPMISRVVKFWRTLRALAGDDAYERYLVHWRACHAEAGDEPMSRKAFFEAEIKRRWNGIQRCC